ncbi:hypothetical protein [Rubrivivax rivuli]|uniref:SLH domain-containing protein n=1 Tax=Rubrivivax rivuli TaxID=1862385 RepID=A0A437RAG1_9BURK|nr:hypothetical protein [Rubrivivax rivuli]RVU43759.1 hypothetical protein EOE66_18970 [Rubrivivax rivuli]
MQSKLFFPILILQARHWATGIAVGLLMFGASTTYAQTSATAPVSADCTVPHFTVAATNLGEVSTRSQGLDCAGRQRALAFFGRTARQMEHDASAARAGPWTVNGERWGREAADLAVKSSLVKAGVDLLVAKAAYNVELARGESGKALSKAAAGVLKEGAVFASRLFCSNGSACSPATESTYTFVAESLKLVAQVPACAERNVVKCADAVRSTAKLFDLVRSLSGQPSDSSRLQQWAQFLAAWVGSSVDLGRAATSGNMGSALAASGALVETALSSLTGKFFRTASDLPTGVQNAVEILGHATATWTACKGAEMAVASLRPGEVSAASLNCVSKLNDYVNTRLAEIMGYSMALFQASKEQYQASTIDGARVVMGEVLRLGGWEPTFRTYGLAVDERTVLATSKDLRISKAVTRIAARYGVGHSGVASLHSNWWDGWAGDVLRLVQSTYWENVRSGARALMASPPAVDQYAGVRFETAAHTGPPPTATLERPATNTWNGIAAFPVRVRASLPNQGVTLQLLSPAGQIVAAAPMAQTAAFGHGAEQWSLDLSVGTAFVRVPEGPYSLRAVVVGMDNKGAWSALEGLTVQRAAQAALAVRLLTANTVSRPDGLLTVRAETSAAAGLVPSLVVNDLRGATVFQAPFNLKLAAAGSTEPWQYSAPVSPALKPGDYFLIAQVQSADGRSALSAPLPLRIEPLVAQAVPSPTPAVPPVLTPTPNLAPPPSASPAPIIVQLSITPQPAQSGQNLTFTALLDRAAEVVRGELIFVDAGGVAEPLVQTGPAQWSRSRPITQAGVNRPVEVRLQTRSGVWITKSGSYTVASTVGQQPQPTPLSPVPAVLQPWQQSSLAFVNNYLEGRARWTDCWEAGAGKRGTYCYRFARQAVGLPAMGSANDAFDNLLDQGRASTAGFETAPIGALIFYRFGAYGHVAVKISATEVAGHGNELAFTSACPPITRVSHTNLTARASYAGYHAPGAGAVTLDPNLIPAGQRVTRQAFLQKLLSAVRTPVDPVATGIIQGSNLSEPNRAITRGEAFLLLGRTLTLLSPGLPRAPQSALTFADAPFGEVATLLGVLSAHGIVQGQANELAAGINAFPDRQLSASESEAVLVRAHSLLAAKQGNSTQSAPPLGPASLLAIQQIAANPSLSLAGQPITFSVSVANPNLLAKAEVVFLDAGAPPEPMTQIGPNQWARSRPISQAGIDRPFEIRLTSTNGSVVTQRGKYTVQMATPQPIQPLPVPPVGMTPPSPAQPVPVPASSGPVISNITVNAAGSPVIVFDVRPAASRATLRIPGRSFQFTCSGSDRVTCVCTSLWAPALRGTFAAQIEAFDAAGRSSGVMPFVFTR